jgi:hypothetical protein
MITNSNQIVPVSSLVMIYHHNTMIYQLVCSQVGGRDQVIHLFILLFLFCFLCFLSLLFLGVSFDCDTTKLVLFSKKI